MCVCVCVCVCARARVRACVRMSVFVRLCLSVCVKAKIFTVHRNTKKEDTVEDINQLNVFLPLLGVAAAILTYHGY